MIYPFCHFCNCELNLFCSTLFCDSEEKIVEAGSAIISYSSEWGKRDQLGERGGKYFQENSSKKKENE